MKAKRRVAASTTAALLLSGTATVLLAPGARAQGGMTGPGGVGAATCTGPTAVCEDFENQEGTTPSGAWSVVHPDCQGSGTASVDNSVAHSGSRSIRVDGTAGYCNHVFVRSSADLSALGSTWYARLYVRHTTPLPPDHVTFLAMRDDGIGGRDLRIGGQNGALQWNRASDDATLPEQSPAGVALSRPLATDTWQCLEFRVSGDGTAATWVDGTQVVGLTADGTKTHDVDGQWYNTAWRPALRDFRFGWESYGNGADTLWFDDIVLGASRVGC